MGVTMWKLLTIVAILTCNPSLGQDELSEDTLNSLELDKPLEDSLKRTYECPEYDIEFKGYDINSGPVPGVTSWPYVEFSAWGLVIVNSGLLRMISNVGSKVPM